MPEQLTLALSEPAVEASPHAALAMRRFAGIDLERVPDETMVCKFRKRAAGQMIADGQ